MNNVRMEETSSMSVRSRYHPKYYVLGGGEQEIALKITLAHFLETVNSCFKANATADKEKNATQFQQ